LTKEFVEVVSLSEKVAVSELPIKLGKQVHLQLRLKENARTKFFDRKAIVKYMSAFQSIAY